MEELRKELAGYIDHTLLKPDAMAPEIERVCDEAIEHRFYSVCVNTSWIETAVHRLEDSGVHVCAVVGFPLGACDPDVKRYEAEVAVDLGAHEIDMVVQIGWLREGRTDLLKREIRDVIEAADERPVKVILETCLLTDEQKRLGCRIADEAGAHFVKTSTGFGGGGATVEDVALMRDAVKQKLGVKASGGIRDTVTAIKMLRAGANRLGTSNSVAIVEGLREGMTL